jgi:hypothetical protein
MTGYEDYIKNIKDDSAPADFDGLYRSLGRRIARQQKVRIGGALAGACAIIMIGLVAYFGYPLAQGGNGQLMSYVFDQQELSDGPVINYVFSDGGTF